MTSVVSSEGFSDDEVVRLAAAVETATRHPLAEAVLNEAGGRGLSVPPVQDRARDRVRGCWPLWRGSSVRLGRENGAVSYTQLTLQTNREV